MTFFSSIGGGQYIIIGLVLLITAGGFLEAAGDSKFRLTFSRLLVALIVPVVWILLVLFVPLGSWISWMDSASNGLNEVIRFIINGILVVAALAVAIMGVPLIFVMSIVVWVGASLTGTLREEISSIQQAISAALPWRTKHPDSGVKEAKDQD
ncbi:MAG: hypothetical protein V4671_11625 [Armatimonadota bacterium]